MCNTEGINGSHPLTHSASLGKPRSAPKLQTALLMGQEKPRSWFFSGGMLEKHLIGNIVRTATPGCGGGRATRLGERSHVSPVP